MWILIFDLLLIHKWSLLLSDLPLIVKVNFFLVFDYLIFIDIQALVVFWEIIFRVVCLIFIIKIFTFFWWNSRMCNDFIMIRCEYSTTFIFFILMGKFPWSLFPYWRTRVFNHIFFNEVMILKHLNDILACLIKIYYWIFFICSVFCLLFC